MKKILILTTITCSLFAVVNASRSSSKKYTPKNSYEVLVDEEIIDPNDYSILGLLPDETLTQILLNLDLTSFLRFMRSDEERKILCSRNLIPWLLKNKELVDLHIRFSIDENYSVSHDLAMPLYALQNAIIWNQINIVKLLLANTYISELITLEDLKALKTKYQSFWDHTHKKMSIEKLICDTIKKRQKNAVKVKKPSLRQRLQKMIISKES